MERGDMLLPYRGGVKANLYLPVPPSDLLKLVNMIRFGLRHFKVLREIKLLFLEFS